MTFQVEWPIPHMGYVQCEVWYYAISGIGGVACLGSKQLSLMPLIHCRTTFVMGVDVEGWSTPESRPDHEFARGVI